MPQTAFDLSASQGAAVLGLLERAHVPPQPDFYRLLYDYVAGVPGAVAGRIETILNDDEGDTQGRLYAEFVAPYENSEPLERAVSKMVSRLKTIDYLIGRSAEATTENSRSLHAAGQHLSHDRLDAALLGEWILRLKVNNERMRRANLVLSQQLAQAHEELLATQVEIARSREGALLDALTGVANRVGIDAMFARLRRDAPDQVLSVALLDIDHFKTLNDTYGHQLGDKVLRVVGRALVEAAGSKRLVGRLGGDEFAIILPDAALEAAHDAAESLRHAVAASDLSDALGGAILGAITASLGVAELQPGETIREMLERADRCLYRAKQSGRNRVEAYIEG